MGDMTHTVGEVPGGGGSLLSHVDADFSNQFLRLLCVESRLGPPFNGQSDEEQFNRFHGGDFE